MKYLIIIIAVLSFSFTQKEPIDSTIIKGQVSPSITMLYLRTMVANEELTTKIPVVNGKFTHALSIDDPLYATLSDADDITTLLILMPQETTIISQDSIGAAYYSNRKADVELNAIGKSLNNWLAWKLYKKQASGKSELKNPDEVKMGIKDWMKKERFKIDSLKSDISDFEYKFLTNNMTCRAYSFLLYYGILMSDIPSTDVFFDFVNDIDVEESMNGIIYSSNVLHKLEIDYNRKLGKIKSLTDFFSFITNSIQDVKLRSYYQAIFIKKMIDNPNYWLQFSELVNPNSLKDLENSFNDSYPNSEYAKIFEEYTKVYLTLQPEEEPQDFWALHQDGDTLRLSDLKGKVILIDVWATWCGPCISERPKVLRLIDHYKGEEDFIPLMISTDGKMEVWKKFILKEKHYLPNNVILVGKEEISFGINYNIESIPRYILIGKSGKFISSRLENLDFSPMVDLIDSALEE